MKYENCRKCLVNHNKDDWLKYDSCKVSDCIDPLDRVEVPNYIPDEQEYDYVRKVIEKYDETTEKIQHRKGSRKKI